MSAYYYFVATLPSLQPAMAAPPMPLAEFLDRASRFLSGPDMEALRGAALYVPDDGAPPPATASSTLLRRYYRWEAALRNELARLRAGRLQKQPERHLRPADPEWDANRTAQAAFQAEDPLQGELVIERDRWAFVEGMAVNKFFDMDFLMSYALLVQVLERRARFDADKGREGYRTVYQSVLDTAEYRDESGDSK